MHVPTENHTTTTVSCRRAETCAHAVLVSCPITLVIYFGNNERGEPCNRRSHDVFLRKLLFQNRFLTSNQMPQGSSFGARGRWDSFARRSAFKSKPAVERMKKQGFLFAEILRSKSVSSDGRHASGFGETRRTLNVWRVVWSQRDRTDVRRKTTGNFFRRGRGRIFPRPVVRRVSGSSIDFVSITMPTSAGTVGKRHSCPVVPANDESGFYEWIAAAGGSRVYDGGGGGIWTCKLEGEITAAALVGPTPGRTTYRTSGPRRRV